MNNQGGMSGHTPPPPPPGGGGPQYRTGPDLGQTLPWEAVLSPKTLLDTWVMVTFKPKEAFALPAQGDWVKPVIYAAALAVINVIINLIFHGIAMGGVGFASALISLAMMLVVGLPLGTGLLMLGFYVFGHRPGFMPLLRVVGYSYSSAIFSILPMVGGILSLAFSLWILIQGTAATFGLTPRQTTWPVVVAILVPVLLMLFLAGSFLGGMMAAS